MPLCGNCHKHHPTVSDVKRCHGLPVTPPTGQSVRNERAKRAPRKGKKKPKNIGKQTAKRTFAERKKKPKRGGGRPGPSNSMGFGADRYPPAARGRPEMPTRAEKCPACGRIVSAIGHCGCR
jgi:hypothetical protein